MAGNPHPEADSSQAVNGEEFMDVEANPQQYSGDTDTRSWIVRYLAQDVNTDHADLIFLVCYFLSGLSDSSAYRAWGCFVSMQTGKIFNTLPIYIYWSILEGGRGGGGGVGWAIIAHITITRKYRISRIGSIRHPRSNDVPLA